MVWLTELKSRKSVLAAVVAALVMFGIFGASHVSDVLTAADRLAMRNLIDSVSSSAGDGESDILVVYRLQREILRRVPIGDGIELGRSREPEDVLEAGRGLCFDHARLMKKALMALGFDVRNVFLLYTSGANIPQTLLLLFSAGAPTHVVLEVKLANGWVYVDTNYPWIGTSSERSIFGAEHNPIARPNLKIRGLYSRNGKLFPPYNSIPDLNYPEFVIGNLSAAFGGLPERTDAALWEAERVSEAQPRRLHR